MSRGGTTSATVSNDSSTDAVGSDDNGFQMEFIDDGPSSEQSVAKTKTKTSSTTSKSSAPSDDSGDDGFAALVSAADIGVVGSGNAYSVIIVYLVVSAVVWIISFPLTQFMQDLFYGTCGIERQSTLSSLGLVLVTFTVIVLIIAFLLGV